MTTDQILSLAPALAEFLDEFDDCFGRSEPREHLCRYVRGQLSNLQRKSVEPIALFNNIAPRTLQEFLNSDAWDHPRAASVFSRSSPAIMKIPRPSASSTIPAIPNP